jgi:hypothetical protein
MQNTLKSGDGVVTGAGAGAYFVNKRYLLYAFAYSYLTLWFEYILAEASTITVEIYTSADVLLSSTTFTLTAAASFASSGYQNITLASLTTNGIYYFKIKSSKAIQINNFCANLTETGVS